MSTSILPLLLVLIASIFQGSFGLGMKFMKPLTWEAWWLVHATIAMLLVPIAWAILVVPNLGNVILLTDSSILFKGMFYGFLWGIGGILFGKCVPYIGISLTYGIVMGLCAAVGSILPLLGIDNLNSETLTYIFCGIGLMLLGVAFTAYAGVLKDKSETDQKSFNFKTGLLLAALSGVLSALLNVGFVEASPVGSEAINQGALERNSSLAVWVVVLIGAYLMNAGYALFLLIKNKTFGSFKTPQASKAYTWAIVSGLFWFGALGVYGQGATLMGDLGAVIGWPILLGISLIVSNIWAYLNKEWEINSKAFKWLIFGLVILILATCVLGYSNQFL